VRRKSLVTLSVVGSVLAHFFFLGAAFYLKMPSMDNVMEDTSKMFQIKKVELQQPKIQRQQIVDNYRKQLKFQTPEQQIKRFSGLRSAMREDLAEPIAIQRKREQAVLEKEVEKKTTTDNIKLKKEQVKIDRRAVVDKQAEIELDLFSSQGLMEGTESALPSLSVHPEFAESMAGFMPKSVSVSATRTYGERAFDAAAGGQGEHEAIDSYVHVGVAKYWSESEKKGYFRITVSADQQSEALEVIAKEVVFLVDASLSIKRRRLEAFKEGIRYAIANLNEGDHFNIVAFRDETEAMSTTSVEVNASSLQAAEQFLQKIRAGSRTSIYKAFIDSIKSPAYMLPSYLVLLSDGRPTYDVRSSANLIGEIMRVNANMRSIFAISGGTNINRFLMDFLSYQNRGWSEFAQNDEEISDRIASWYDKISNPVLRNVRYQVTPLEATDFYPQRLPDIYRDTEFILYGRYDKEQEFSVRILGEAEGRTKELIFTYDLRAAPQGTADISRYWAFNKIYHLIGQMTIEGYSEAHIAEIRQLTEKYKIEIPYEVEKLNYPAGEGG